MIIIIKCKGFLFLRKRFRLKSFVSILLLVLMFFIPLIAIPVVKNMPNPLGYAENSNESVILELWNIDTFEGGSLSKNDFLQKKAMQFKQQNNQVYIITKNLNYDKAKSLLENNQKPDMVSFGLGAGDLFLPFLNPINSLEAKPCLLEYGKYDNKQLCVPWCMGAYVLCSFNGTDISNLNSWITFEKKNLLGFGGVNNVALLALKENKADFKLNRKLLYESSCDNNYSQYQAYKDFISNKFDVLLGTQRDCVRALNRMEKGIFQCCFNFLDGFSDLVQWFGVLKADGATRAICENFLSFLLSVENQHDLSKMSMFSVVDELIYTTDSDFAAFEQKQKQISKSLNAFLCKQEIENEQKKAIENIFA